MERFPMIVDYALGCLLILLACACVWHRATARRAVRRRRPVDRRLDRRVRD